MRSSTQTGVRTRSGSSSGAAPAKSASRTTSSHVSRLAASSWRGAALDVEAVTLPVVAL